MEVESVLAVIGRLPDIVREEAAKCGIDPDQVFERDRTAPVAWVRARVCVRLRELGLSLSQIGRLLGLDHTSVLHNVQRDIGDPPPPKVKKRALISSIINDAVVRQQEKCVQRNAAIVAAYQTGRSLEDVGREFGVTRERVSQILIKMGCEERHGGSMMPRKIAIRKRREAAEERMARKLAARAERNAMICALYQEGKTYNEICAAMGFGGGFIPSVANVVRDAGIINRLPSVIGKVKRRVTAEERQEIARRYSAGDNLFDIARDFDIAVGTVINIAGALGARRPRPPRPQQQTATAQEFAGRLNDLLSRGKSFGDCAAELGCSRSRIAGLVYRAKRRAAANGESHG